VFVDADHASNKVARRSRTGITVFLMSDPVMWCSKQQSSIEASSFGSEFSALKASTEKKGLWHKLRMMGVPTEGPAHVRADNAAHNAAAPESTLKKNSNYVAHHFMHGNIAASEKRFGREMTGILWINLGC